MTADGLPKAWYDRAEQLDPYAPAAAEAFRRCAQQLHVALHESGAEPLTLEQAAAASGYSVDHLARQVREGRIPNAGGKRRPRIRREDLPRKPGANGAQHAG